MRTNLTCLMAFVLIFVDLPVELYLPLWIPASFPSFHFKGISNSNLLLWVQVKLFVLNSSQSDFTG